MPYYHWKGVTLTGAMKKGTLFGRNSDHLDQLLLKRQIALVAHKPKKYLIQQSINLGHKAEFFRQLSILIDAGVLVPDALTIVGDQLDHPQLQEVVHAVAIRVHEGVSLSDALSAYPTIFNEIMIQLVRAGEESGSLGKSLDGICGHLLATQDFYTRIRAALLLPIITLSFFLVIVLLIFIIVLPHFSDIFASMKQEMPPLTKTLLALSAFMASTKMIVVVLGVAIFALLFFKLTQHGRGRVWRDAVILRIPFIGSLVQERFLAYAMQSLALLLEGGMPLAQSLEIVKNAIPNKKLQMQLAYLEWEVLSGNMLSDAMARHPHQLFSQDVVAMVEVGQESGNLAPLLKRVGRSYHERLTKKLAGITMLLQPTLMIILGLLVGMLIFAVYGPIFNLAAGL